MQEEESNNSRTKSLTEKEQWCACGKNAGKSSENYQKRLNEIS